MTKAQTNTTVHETLPVSNSVDGLLQRTCECGNHSSSGECAGCRKKQGITLQRSAINSGSAQAPAIVDEVLRSPGQPLDANTRSFMESRFGYDFSSVRLHTDTKAAQSAATVNALAYTVGRDIVVQPQYYKPGSNESKKLLAHELTHVVQQGHGALALAQQQIGNRPGNEPGPTRGTQPMQAKLQIGESGDQYEREADAVAERVMRMSDPEPRSQADSTAFLSVGVGNNGANSSVQTMLHNDRPALRRLSISGLLGPNDEEMGVQPEREEEEPTGTLQAKLLPGHSAMSTTQSEAGIQTLKTGLAIQRVPGRFDEGGRHRGGDDGAIAPRGATLPHREATELGTCVRIMGEANTEYCRQEVLGERPMPPAPLIVCDPNRALTWADFQGSPRRGTFSAETAFHFNLVTENNRQIIRAVFDAGRSWVRPQFADPTNQTVNGCGPRIASCRRHFSSIPAGRTGTFSLGAARGCPAAPSPNTSLNATNSGECATVLGVECDRVAALESERLLRHEQLHFTLACVMAQKGTDALVIRPASQAPRILTAVRTKSNQQTIQYDNQSNHGCIAAQQANWETQVQNGLPTVTIP